MTFAARISRLPRPFDAERGAETLARVPWAQGDVARLLEGAGGSSPYLNGLIAREGAWLEPALDAPETAFADTLHAVSEAPEAGLAGALRQAKRRLALLIGLADLAGVWPLETVTLMLTRFADCAVQRAVRAGIAHEITRGKLPGAGPQDIPSAAGLVVLAMGKMGAFELNYSSDIDLICLFDEERYARTDYHEARDSLIRATRRMAAMLSDLTGDGYVFRTDLRLRPDPSVTPVCLSMDAAERYYESLGRAWERAAYVKARPCAGDLAAGARFLQNLAPFVWRKHLDFAAIQDAHDMRLRIRDHRGLHGPITLPGHNMKLGRGGIREIEFFTQTRQIIAGGRDPDLRVRGTVEALGILAAKGWVPEQAASVLAQHYAVFREIEHRVQMVNDAQTHDLPKSPDGFERLAALTGQDTTALKADLTTRLQDVHDLIESFFDPDAARAPARDDACTSPLEDSDIPRRWPSYPALRSERAVQIFRRLRPQILTQLSTAARPDEALAAFDGFLSGLPAGVQLFSLFDANPQLIDLLIDIVSVSPDLSRYLSRNAAVFDAVIAGEFFGPWPGRASLEEALLDRLTREDGDYERQLDLARRWVKEWHFRVGVHLLRGLMDAEEAGRAYADLAVAALGALFPVVQADFARKHGPPPGRGAVVLGMGSLGAGRLHARSDLDLIVIYDPLDQAFSDGPRPLAATTYFARLTKALVTAVSAPMAEGKLYDVDMRLRPSGNQGPVATAWRAFQDYQRRQAWTWEHMALTRARVVAGHEALAADVEAFRTDLLSAPRDRSAVLQDVARMRARIASAKRPGNDWDPKVGPGRMQDIELFSQAGALLAPSVPADVAGALGAMQAEGLVTQAASEDLRAAYDLAWRLQIGARLVTEEALEPGAVGAGGCAFLTRLTGVDDMAALADKIDRQAQRAAGIIKAALPPAQE